MVNSAANEWYEKWKETVSDDQLFGKLSGLLTSVQLFLHCTYIIVCILKYPEMLACLDNDKM